MLQKQLITRKSFCVNAKGILPATYQVLHLLSYPGGGGNTPSLARGCTTSLAEGGIPSLAAGYPMLLPPIWDWGTPHLGAWDTPPPRKDMGLVEVLWDGDGVPQEGHGTSESIMGWRWGKPPSPPLQM